MGPVEIVEGLLRVECLLLGERDLTLVQQAERRGRQLPRLVDPLGTNGECRVQQFRRCRRIVARERDPDEARPERLDTEPPLEVAQESVLVTRGSETRFE